MTLIPADTPRQLFIDGQLADALSGETFETVAPGDGAHLAAIASAGSADVDLAVLAARRSFAAGVWSGKEPGARKQALIAFADLLEDHASELAHLDAIEAGKPYEDCLTGDIPDGIGILRWFAEAIDKVFGKVAPSAADHLAIVVREPIGVVAVVTPWNFPVATLLMKLAPALAAGNSVVVKPSELASLSTLRVAELAIEAGIPAGVLNVVTGAGATAGRALGLHPEVDLVTFTGSTAVGREFLRYSADSNLKEVLLELGGKSPQIVTASMCDELASVAEELAVAAFWNAGQNCTAGSRILVDNRIKAQLIEALVAEADGLVVGDPLDADTTLGPVIHEAALERMLGAVDAAVADGATLVRGGKRLLADSGGSYIGATILTGLPRDHAICRDELFGPVVVVLGFDTEEEAISLANETQYGLAATIWSRDIDQVFRFTRQIEAGMVSVNGYSEGDASTPFGGWKRSGFGGQENGIEALEKLTALKTVWLNLR